MFFVLVFGVLCSTYLYNNQETMRNKIIPYRPDLRAKARELRKHGTMAEALLWNELKNKQLDFQFHRQVPMLDYIVDFFCHELALAIEIDGITHEYKVGYDQVREERLSNIGIKLLRYQDEEVRKNIKWVVNDLYNRIQEFKP